MQTDEYWMQQAIAQAHLAQACGEIPIGAVLVKDDACIAQSYNQPISTNDPTAHAEILVLREAAKQLQNYRLLQTTLYVTLEPCAMCVGAILHARIKRLVFGALDPRAGALQSVFQIADEPRLNHRLYWQGEILPEECGALLKSFFQQRR